MTSTDGRAVLRWAGITDVGKVRTNNEDQFMLRPELQLWVVADGMGGHRGGEVASDLACKEMARSYQERTIDGLVGAVTLANRTVYEAGLRDPDLRGMGTTLVALAVVEDDELASGAAPQREMLAIANVGDSRAYRLTRGQLEQVTEDHSLVADLVREGSLSPDEAESHPQKNILTRVLGVSEDVPVDIITKLPLSGDRYLLCSDGLFNEVTEDEIATVLQQASDPDAAADELLRLALSGSARDNTTIVIVDVLDDGQAGSIRSPAAAAAAPNHAVTRTAETRPISAYSDVDDNGNGNGDLAIPAARGVATATATALATDADTAELETLSEPDEASGRKRRRNRRRGEADLEDGEAKPRRFTWRVLLFILLLLAVFAGAIATYQWYGKAAYFVAFEGDEVVIYQGRPGGLPLIDPELVERSELQRREVPAEHVAAIEEGREFSSQSDARHYVARLEERAQQSQQDEEPAEEGDQPQADTEQVDESAQGSDP